MFQYQIDKKRSLCYQNAVKTNFQYLFNHSIILIKILKRTQKQELLIHLFHSFNLGLFAQRVRFRTLKMLIQLSSLLKYFHLLVSRFLAHSSVRKRICKSVASRSLLRIAGAKKNESCIQNTLYQLSIVEEITRSFAAEPIFLSVRLISQRPQMLFQYYFRQAG